ncbi:MAG: AbfB domain-containing protein, partial [Bacteroidetes bacterium]|nr:AbfB domain-containing protein [Bacteroidota bacterium]
MNNVIINHTGTSSPLADPFISKQGVVSSSAPNFNIHTDGTCSSETSHTLKINPMKSVYLFIIYFLSLCSLSFGQQHHQTNIAYLLELHSSPKHYLGFSSGNTIVSEILPNDEVGHAFQLINGLGDISAVSLESVKLRGYYLCSTGGKLALQARSNNPSFNLDEATFYIQEGLIRTKNSVSFTSKSDRGKYIVRDGNTFKIANDGIADFQSNATFFLKSPPAFDIPERVIRSEERELREGIHFYRHNGSEWEEVTDDQGKRDLTNLTRVPKGSSNDYQDWYFMEMDRNLFYRFSAESNDFTPKMGDYFQYDKNHSNLKSPQGFNKRIAIVHPRTGLEEFQPDNSGAHWVLVTNNPGREPGTYTFTYTTYSQSDTKVSYSEASIVAGLNIPNLSPGVEKAFINFDGFSLNNSNIIITRDGTQIKLGEGDFADLPVTEMNNFDPADFLSEQNILVPEREAYIQHIIYKVSEIFSPFDVVVSRLKGTSNLVPSRTYSNVFVGDDPHGNIYGFARTSFRGFDFGNKNMDVGWVDYKDPSGRQYTIEQLINTISHEIGHTFGLKHVRTNGPDYPSSFANLESWLSTSPVAPDPPGLPVQSNSPIPPTIPSNIPEVM